MTYGVGTRAWIPIWWIPTLCPCSLHFSAASRWRKESREVFVEQTHYMCLKSGPCRNHVIYIQISLWRVNFRRRVKMGTSIHPQSPQTQSLQFSMEKKKKKTIQKRKRVSWVGYTFKPFGQYFRKERWLMRCRGSPGLVVRRYGFKWHAGEVQIDFTVQAAFWAKAKKERRPTGLSELV